jgi:hypothetical protein
MILVIGDLHLQPKAPKYQQVLEFINLIFDNKEYNNPDNTLVFLGDLVESLNSSPELLAILVDIFLNKSRFKLIKILQGNHDASILSSLLSLFKPFANIEIIVEPKVKIIEGKSCLFLPYYYHEAKGIQPMIERYSNLYKEAEFSGEFDYCFHHVEDETNHFSKKFCDLSKLKVVKFLAGHMHIETLSSGGRYLGAPILNSSTESGKTPYIALISSDKCTLIKIEKTLEYDEINYPSDLPKKEDLKAKYVIWKVNDSLNKEETIKFYTEQAIARGYEFYYRRIDSKKIKENFLLDENKEKEISLTEHFQKYATINKVSEPIQDICLSVLKTRSA